MAFNTKNAAKRLVYAFAGAQVFWHRPFYERLDAYIDACTVRGETNFRLVNLVAVQDVVDGWDTEVLDADDQPLPVPEEGSSAPEWEEPFLAIAARLGWGGRRQRIAQIVRSFPNPLIVGMATLIFDDTPEALRKNWPPLSTGNSASPTDGPDTSFLVATADASAAAMGSPSPATEGV